MTTEDSKPNKTKAWIKAMRLRTLPLSFSVIIVGNAIGFSQSWDMEAESNSFSWNIFGLTLLTTLLLQVLSNFANDYGDSMKGADNDNRVGPERAIQSGIISPEQMKKAMIITSILALCSGIGLLLMSFGSLINWTFIVFLILGLLAIVAAIKYTVGKGAYGYMALGDFFVFAFFGILGVCGSMFLQTLEFIPESLFSGMIMGCFAVAVLNLNNMRDRVNDAQVGKKTLAVILGFQRSKTYHYALFIIAWSPFIYLCLLDWVLASRHGVFYLPILIFHLVHLRKVYKTKEPSEYDPELKKIALSTFAFAIIFFLDLYIVR